MSRLILVLCLAVSACSTTPPPVVSYPTPPDLLMRPPQTLKPLPLAHDTQHPVNLGAGDNHLPMIRCRWPADITRRVGLHQPPFPPRMFKHGPQNAEFTQDRAGETCHSRVSRHSPSCAGVSLATGWPTGSSGERSKAEIR